MKNYNLYKCKVERSRINGNYTVWLPEQEDNDFVQMIVDNNSFSHGTFWERLVKVSANEFGLDISEVYFAPEADVFVSYTSSFQLAKEMEAIFNNLITNFEFLRRMVIISGIQYNYN